MYFDQIFVSKDIYRLRLSESACVQLFYPGNNFEDTFWVPVTI